MELMYKPDWEETKARLLAWWAHDEMERCALGVIAPKAGISPEPPPKLPARVEDRWLDFDYLDALNEYTMRRTFYGGETFPVWSPGYPGWDLLAVALGADIDLKEETGWASPVISEGELTGHDYRRFKLSRENRWWDFSLRMCAHTAQQAKGKSLPGIQALAACGDTLAALRGTNNLLTDCIDCPETVREFELYLMTQWIEAYEALYGIIREGAEGSTCWFNLWSPGRFFPAACDFAYMISTKMFTDIFMPAIELQVSALDHAVFHLDGPGVFAHVDALLELKGLQAFQVLPGAGNPSPLHYADTLNKIQAAGRNLHIALAPDEVEAALGMLSPRGLYIQTACSTEEEAALLLKNAVKWSRGKG